VVTGELFVQVRQHNKKMRKKTSAVTQRKKSEFYVVDYIVV